MKRLILLLFAALICSRPNCKHDDPESCTSFGMRNHPTIFGDKLFFFSTAIGEKKLSEDEIFKN